MIVGITESRLSQGAYDFNTQIPEADQTIEKLVANMVIGETTLPIEKQVVHVSSVTTTSNRFSCNCSYHMLDQHAIC
jgi:hypothetical protein